MIDSLGTGGAEKLVVDTANAFASRNYQVHVITTVSGNGALAKDLHSSIIYTHICSSGKSFFSGLFMLKKYIRENTITHIHAHLYHSMILSRLTAGSAKLFFTYHNMEYDAKDMFFSRRLVWIDRLTLRDTHTSLYVSKPVMNTVQKIRGKKGNEYVLYNFPSGSFQNLWQYNPQPSLRLVTVGSVKPVKNFNFLLNVFNQLKDQNIHLDIIGDGESRNGLQRIIDTEQIANVKLCGKKMISSELLAQYDMFVMSSHSEGMPVALIEAMATGLPSVLPAHLDVMKDVADDSAVYFSIHDQESLIVQLINILQNKPMLKKMHEQSVEKSKEFSLQNHITTLLKIYQI